MSRVIIEQGAEIKPRLLFACGKWYLTCQPEGVRLSFEEIELRKAAARWCAAMNRKQK